ncbi:MAG: MATE family efflux transporter [Gudongella sp.]|nr:MATE family efflux transporter [Gudongella sp.]
MVFNENRRNLILAGRPYSLAIKMSIPAIAGMVSVALYSFMDSIFVGQMIDGYAMTAVSVTYPFTLLNTGISALVGVGSASVLSRAIGRRDGDTTDRIMGNLLTTVTVLSLAVMAVMLVFTRPILSLTGAEGQVLEYAVSYAGIVFLGSVFVNLAQASNMVLRGEGVFREAMGIMAAGAILNIILDPVFITAFGDNGIEGAAWATVVSQAVQLIITLVYFKRRKEGVRLSAPRFDRTIASQVSSVGMSAMLMQVLTLIQQSLLLWSAARYGGPDYQMIMAAVLRIQAFAFIPLWGVSQGFQPVAGTNYGAGEYGRVRECTFAFIAVATFVALLIYMPMEIMPGTMLSLFITDSAIVSMGIDASRIMFLPFITFGIMIIAITLLQSTGNARTASLLALSRQVFLYVPLVLVVPVLMSSEVIGVFVGSMLAEICVFAICLAAMSSELRKMEKRTEKPQRVLQ